MAKFFDRVMNALMGEEVKNEPAQEPVQEKKVQDIRNEVILKELVTHFEEEMEARSFGSRLLYPMSFTVILEQSDFEARKEEFLFIVPEVIKAFYEKISARIQQYKDYRNPAKWWNIHFIPCPTDVAKQGNKSQAVKKGHIITWASIFDIIPDKDGGTKQEAISVSVRNDQSNVAERMNINRDIIANYDLISRTHMRVKYNPQLKFIECTDMREDTSIAKISYTQGGKKYTFSMTGNNVILSGRSDERKARNIFRLESDVVTTGHAEIRWMPEKKGFYIAAFADTTVDEEPVPLSREGEPNWVWLCDESQVILGDIFLTFETIG